MEETKPSDDFARGAEAMREAASRAVCGDCQRGTPMEQKHGQTSAAWHRAPGWDYPSECRARSIRTLTLTPPDGRRYRVTEEQKS